MYKANLLESIERKQAATDIVYACMEAVGIELNDTNKMIAQGAIEAAVFGLEKTHEE